MLIKVLLGFFSVLLLSSCFATYENKYTFIPPQEKESKICANSCVRERNNCFQKCMQKGEILDLGNKFISAFEQGSSDDNRSTKECNNMCREGHTICHRNCGGSVIVEKVCTAFCGNKK